MVYLCDDVLYSDIALEDFDGFEEDSKAAKLLYKLQTKFREFYDFIQKMLHTIITKITKFFKSSRKKLNGVRHQEILTDTYGYVDTIENARGTIVEYTKVVQKLVDLDQEINMKVKSTILGEIKESVKNTTLKLGKEKSEMYLYSQVESKLDEARKYDQILSFILTKEGPLMPVPHPRRYSMDYIRKQEEYSFSPQLKHLSMLEKSMNDQRKVFDNRSGLFQMLNREHIERGQKILNIISSLIKHINSFLLLYKKLENKIMP